MRLVPSHIAEALIELEESRALSPKQASESLRAFLSRKRSLRLLPAITSAVESALSLRRREVAVGATIAHPVDAATRELITREAAERFGQSGEKVVVTFHEDPALLGGVRLATQDVQYDFSLGRRLQELRSHL